MEHAPAPRPALARGLELAHPYSLPHGTWPHPHDAGIRVTRVEDISQLLCGTITISATGEAARVQAPPWHASLTRTLPLLTVSIELGILKEKL